MSDLTSPAVANGDPAASRWRSRRRAGNGGPTVAPPDVPTGSPDAAAATEALQALPDAAKAGVVTTATQALSTEAKAGVVTTAMQALPDEAKAGVAAAVMQALPDKAKADATTSAAHALSGAERQDLADSLGGPDQAVTNDIWRWIVKTFAFVLCGATVALVSAVFASFWGTVDPALVQMLLTVFTTTAGILAGFLSGRASTGRTRGAET